MVNQNFIIGGIAAALISTILLKIFSPEIDSFTNRVRNAKPNDIGVTPVIGN